MSAEWPGLAPPYGTIVIDPPWRYQRAAGLGGSRAAGDNYSTMSNAEIAALPVGDLAADSAHCYLWVTVPRMFGEAHDAVPPVGMLEAWGFRYVTLLTWVKKGSPGMGWYFRGDTEHVLFGVRGHAPIPAERRMRNVFEAARHGHSVKPTALFDIAERVSPGPYVELFSRAPRLGWDSWGRGFERDGEAS